MPRSDPLQATDVAIIGGGIGGLTAALALLQSGRDVDVYEQSLQTKEVGAGIHISVNGTRVLDALALQDALARVAVIPSKRLIRHWKTGQTWEWFAYPAGEDGTLSSPHLLLHRGDLHSILADAVRRLKPDAIKLGRRCVAVEQSAEKVHIRFDTGEEAHANCIVGADGIHSQVRECLFGADRPEFTGCVAWRGLIPMHRLPERLATSVGTNWLGPNGNVLHYPVRRGELLNFVGTIERDDWRVESWTADGTTAELANDFAGWHSDVQDLIRNIEEPRKWALMVRGPMARWTKGRITLLGDACHPTLPYLGQGAVMAIEDAYIIAACLKHYVPPSTAFARYEALRRERTATIVQKSHENRRQVFSPSLMNEDEVSTSVEREWREVRKRERFDWLYTYDATTVRV
jgi:salicylate hydroxylase